MLNDVILGDRKPESKNTARKTLVHVQNLRSAIAPQPSRQVSLHIVPRYRFEPALSVTSEGAGSFIANLLLELAPLCYTFQMMSKTDRSAIIYKCSQDISL